MINLIPNQDKKKMTRDFYIRLVALSLGMLSICVLFAGASLLPAYFLSATKKNLADTKLQVQKNQVVPELDQKTLSVIQGLNKKLVVVENAEKNTFLVSQKILQEIISKKMPDIKLNQISYENNATKGKVVNVRGSAPSRDRLLLFRQALQADTNFKSVDLPISNFVKGTDIQFNVTLIAS